MSEVNYLDSFTKWKEKKARNYSVNLNKKIREKREEEELNKEKKFEDFIEDLYED